MGDIKSFGVTVGVTRAHKIFTIILIAYQCSFVFPARNSSCVIDLGPYPNRYLPLIVSKTRGILLPAGARNIVVRSGEAVTVACPGKNNGVAGQGAAMLNATCRQSGLLEVTRSGPFAINCTKTIDETVEETNTSCGSLAGSKIINIGWRLPKIGFLNQIEVCFNKDRLETEYTRHVIQGAGVPYRDRDVRWQGRASFKQDNIYTTTTPSIASAFTKEKQKETLENLLGSRETAEYYIGGWGPSSYLAKGHLTPDADFTLQTWQDSTYHFINVVPQWQEFNNGNWKILENATRVQATRPSPRDLVVYTGANGVLMLQDINGNDVPFYLSQGRKRQVPVPKYIWKVVSDRERNEAVAFVLVNHPATTPQYSEPPVCSDVCNRVHWVTWKARNDFHKGIMYCCSVSSLRERFNNVPALGNVRLMER